MTIVAMAAPSHHQSRGDRVVLPGFSELVASIANGQSSPSGAPYSWDVPRTWSHHEAASIPDAYGRYPAGIISPSDVDLTHQAREREEEWRRERRRRTSRPDPTSPRTLLGLPPPSIPAHDARVQWATDATDVYARHWADNGRPASTDEGRGSRNPYTRPFRHPDPYDQDTYHHSGPHSPGYTHGSHPPPRYSQAAHRPGSSGGRYSPEEYSPRGYGVYSNGTHGANGYPVGNYSPAPRNGEPRGRKRPPPLPSPEGDVEGEGKKRRNFPNETIDVLKRWAIRRIDTLKFSSEEKDEIALEAGLERAQVGSWYINYHRRGWAADKFKYYSERLGETEAEYRAAVVAARRVTDADGMDARRTADAEVARLKALLEELRPKERLAQIEYEEYERKKKGC